MYIYIYIYIYIYVYIYIYICIHIYIEREREIDRERDPCRSLAFRQLAYTYMYIYKQLMGALFSRALFARLAVSSVEPNRSPSTAAHVCFLLSCFGFKMPCAPK